MQCAQRATPLPNPTHGLRRADPRRPRERSLRVVPPCLRARGAVITVDPSNPDGSLEEYEIDVPEGSGPGSVVLVDLPAESPPEARIKPKM